MTVSIALNVVANTRRRLRTSATVLAYAFQDLTTRTSRHWLVAKIELNDVVIRARGFSRKEDSPKTREHKSFPTVSQ